MGKTTNILDLNNRLEKVEKKNVAQNNYNSLKNRPKINGNLLTGDKTGAQLGLADAIDLINKPSIISSGFIAEGSHVDVNITDTESLYIVYGAKYDSATIYAVFTTSSDAFPLVLHSGSATVTSNGLTITITPDTNTSCRYTVLKVI